MGDGESPSQAFLWLLGAKWEVESASALHSHSQLSPVLSSQQQLSPMKLSPLVFSLLEGCHFFAPCKMPKAPSPPSSPHVWCCDPLQ